MLTAMGAIRRDPLQYLNSVWSEYGDVVQFPIPRPPSYLVNEPGAVRRVLVGNSRNYGKSTIQYKALSLVTGEGLLTADTATWRRQRPLVQPAFHHETLDAVVGHVTTATRRVIADWSALPDGSIVDADEYMMHAALEVVGHALFGTDLSTDARTLTTATLDALDVVIARARVPLSPPSWLPTPGNRKLSRSVAKLDAAVSRMLMQREGQARGDSTGVDMIDLLRSSRDESGASLSEEEIRNEIVTFIVAGHETVASALSWAWSLLARNPEIQERVAAEADRVLGSRPGTLANYRELTFTKAVFDETLRLYPPAWLITRASLGEDELAGHHIPAGALIIMSPYLLHRHPAVWADASRFDPDRFLRPFERDAFIPFGAGLRLCIGRDFANVEGVLMLAELARAFRVSPLTPEMPEGAPLVTIRPQNGSPVRISRRG
jgi:cytochrome P450